MNVSFLADESFSGPYVRALVAEGFDIVLGADVCFAAPDDRVLIVANGLHRVILTEDYDFGDLVVRDSLAAVGVVIVDVDRAPFEQREALVVGYLQAISEGCVGQLTVIEHHRIRVRELKNPLR